MRADRVALGALSVWVLALFVAGCQSPVADGEAPAFDASLPVGDDQLVYHFPLGATVRVYVDRTNAPASFDLAAAVRHAAAAWRGVVYYREVDVSEVGNLTDADVVVHFDAAPPLVHADCGGLGASGGITAFCPDITGVHIAPLPFASGQNGRQSHVYFDVTISSDPNVVSTQARFQSLVTHELGHVLGIGGHSNDTGDIMFEGASVAEPSANDARTLRWVLHQPVTLPFAPPGTASADVAGAATPAARRGFALP